MPKTSPFLLATLLAGASTSAASAQHASSVQGQVATTSAPVAYLYVDSYATQATAHIYGFAAAQNGTLTSIPGSPFLSPISDFALNGRYLFGAYSNGGSNNAIYTYAIDSNGALHQADVLSNPPINEPIADLTLDHTGNSLYAGFGEGDTAPTGYEAFSINQTNGKLSALNVQQTGGVYDYGSIYFTGNNEYVYGADCYHFTSSIYGFARTQSGALSRLGLNAPLPSPPPNDGYCAGSAVATDPYNDVVIPLFQYSNTSTAPGKPQLAVYTADKYGNLSTTSTYQDMPTPAVEPDFLSMSPAGYYLAVTGSNGGMQIFLMHGSKPPTALTGTILPGVQLGQAFWDHYDHLYVLGQNKVFVFNISTNGITQAPGSPFAVPAASQIAVLPR